MTTSLRDHLRMAPFRTARSWATAVVLLVAAIAAVVLTNSFSARQVADDAQLLDLAEATLGANDVTVKSLSQAVLLAEDFAWGVADEETVELAIAEAQSAVDELAVRAGGLADVAADGDLGTEADAAVALAENVLGLLQQGDAAQASALLSGDGLAAFERLRDTAADEREEAAESVAATRRLAGRVSAIATFLVAFLIPVGAIFAYRRVARGQLRLAEVELDARMEAEQKITHAKDEFIANISHELRTPLTSIYGMSDALLEQGIVDPEMTTELVGIIHTEATELGRMVEDLLTSARAETGSLMFDNEKVSVDEELEVVLAPFRRAGLDVHVEFDSTVAWADRRRVQQMLRNLLSNAQKHGGQRVEITATQRSHDLEITVSDDGDGVPPDQEPRLFTRFVHEGSVPLTTGSVGLGLAVVKVLSEGMAGDVRYVRNDGWSHFLLRLPAEAPADHVGSATGFGAEGSIAVAASEAYSDPGWGTNSNARRS